MKTTRRWLGIAMMGMLLGGAGSAQEVDWTITFTLQESFGVEDKGRFVLSASPQGLEGLDVLDEPLPPFFPHSYVELLTHHEVSEAGWSSMPLPALDFQGEMLPSLDGSARTFVLYAVTDQPRQLKLNWTRDPTSKLAPYYVEIRVAGTAVDYWAKSNVSFDAPGGTPLQVELVFTPGRPTDPWAVDAEVTTLEEVPIAVELVGRDFDDCELTFSRVRLTVGNKGTLGPPQPRSCVAGEPNQDTVVVLYAPAVDQTTPAYINYRVTDARGSWADGTVTVNIQNINDPPVASDQTVTTIEDTPVDFLLAAFDPDPQEKVELELLDAPDHGTLENFPPRFLSWPVTYHPDLNFIGRDEFIYRISDQEFSAEATVTIFVEPFDGPVAILDVAKWVAVGDAVPVDGSGSFHRFPPTSIVEYSFDFGDGILYVENADSAPDGSFDGATTHVFTERRLHDVTLTVMDESGVTDSITHKVQAVAPELSVANVDAGSIRYDGQQLTVSGLAALDVRNLGAPDILRPFDVFVFEDRDLDEQYSPGVDQLLGEATVEPPLAQSETRRLLVPVSGSVLFSENRIWAFVDAREEIDEVNETNNLAHDGLACKALLPTQAMEPQIKWWKKEFNAVPSAKGLDIAPAIVDITGDGIKDVIFVGFPSPLPLYRTGHLRAIDGRDGSELWVVDDITLRSYGGSGVAAADIDGDGLPEFLTNHASGRLAVFEHDGTLKGLSAAIHETLTHPAVADLEGDGVPELLLGGSVMNANGTVRWKELFTYRETDAVVAADLDLDGYLEVIGGAVAYRADGSVYWMALGGPDDAVSGSSALVQLDEDAFPELIVNSKLAGEVYALEHDGSVRWGPVVMPHKPGDPTAHRVGPPSIGDVDGDGSPEIAVASYDELRILNSDGTTRWSAPINDSSSGSSVATFFDLDGDGTQEVIFGDQSRLWIFQGTDGSVLHESVRHSHTGNDLMVVADLEGDGQAELVVGFNGQTADTNGIVVLSAGAGSWVPCRGIFNQQTYHITNISDDVTVPAPQENGWQTHNSFRSQASYGGRAPDLVPSYVRAAPDGGGFLVTARVGNGGWVSAPAGVDVAFYDGDPHAGGNLIASTTTLTELGPGTHEDVSVQMATLPAAAWVWADPADVVVECDDTNNIYDPSRPSTNGAPTAAPDAYQTSEDSRLLVASPGVLGNDEDPDGDVLAAVLESAPPNGSVLLRPDGSFDYLPGPEFSGSDEFTYHATDGALDSSPATVTITVDVANDPPVAEDDYLELDEDTPTSIRLVAHDVEGDPLSYAIVDHPDYGSLSGTPPEVTYTPAPDWSGLDSFTFEASDGQATSNLAVVTLRVWPVNDPPTAYDQSATTPENTPVSIVVVATDPEGKRLTYRLVDAPTNGSVVNSGSNFIYSPDESFIGTDSFTYLADDGELESNVATVTIEVTGAGNQAPVAEDQAVQTDEDVSRAITLVATDADNDPLSYEVTGGPSNGSLSGTAPDVTYTPNPNWYGIDSFTFKANDGQEDSNEARVTITVTPVNDPPVALDQSVSTDEDVSIDITLVATDVESDPLTFAVTGGPSNGTLSGTPPDVTYKPNADWYGTDSFTFEASDGQATSNTATVTITVTPVNDPPVALDQSVSTDEDVSIDITLVATDVEGDPLTFAVTGGPSDGTLSGTPPSLTYKPNADWYGIDSFTFEASDGQATSNTATVTITVNPLNDPPVAQDQSVATDEDTPIDITLVATDVEGDPLTYAVTGGPSNGALSGAPPNVTYKPNADWYGIDSFTFEASDGQATSNTATVTITVNPVNDPPVAFDQSVTTDEDTSVDITLVATDVENDPLTFSITDGPSEGTLTGTPPDVTYTPRLNWFGTDTFTFKANDGQADSNEAMVTITVASVNDPPDCTGAWVDPDRLWPPNHKMRSLVINGVQDPDGDPVTVEVTSIFQDEPTNGLGDGDKSPDATLAPPAVRSERQGGGNGRVYHVTFTAEDPSGAVCTETLTICVPHDQSTGTCIDEGPLFDSTQP